MKKLILLFYIVLLCASCDPPQNAWAWFVQNKTEQTLKLKFPYSNTYQISVLQPGEEVGIYKTRTNTDRRYNLHFGYYFEMIVSEHEEEVYWQILSEDDTILKTWSYSDKDLLDLRFFEEFSWNKKQEPGSGFNITRYFWTFEILPEDISSN